MTFPVFVSDNPRKCRARYGMEQQHMWCGPCRYVRVALFVCEAYIGTHCTAACVSIEVVRVTSRIACT